MTTKKLLGLLDGLTKHNSSSDRALYLLLCNFEKEITGKIEFDPTGYWFHKSFRQTDVTGSANLDMAIWLLISRSVTFWEAVKKLGDSEDSLKNE